MQYVILIYGDESGPGPAPGSPEFEQYMATWMGFHEELKSSGHFVAGSGLMPTSTATTLRRTFGEAEPTVTDGPFAETKESLGGYYEIDVADLDEALAWARKLPVAAGSIEVRPVANPG
jgi:hypothetical protein